MTPKVSIIVPCYNAEAWVAEALDSALAQSWPNVEVIAVNDGSKDGSLAVLWRYAGPRVLVLDQPNRGASAARNAGLRAATGDLIQFLDADDLLDAEKISTQMALLAASPPGSIASGSWSRFVREPASSTNGDSPLFNDFTPVAYVTTNIRTGAMMHPAAWLVPAAVAARAGPWNEQLSLNDDGEYFARVALASAGIVYSRASQSFYRSGLPGSLSRQSDRRALESLYLSCELVSQHLLAAENNPVTRQAVADYFQRLVYETYPEAPDLSHRAASHAASFGGSSLQPEMGRRQRILARLVGWKLARRLVRALRR